MNRIYCDLVKTLAVIFSTFILVQEVDAFQNQAQIDGKEERAAFIRSAMDAENENDEARLKATEAELHSRGIYPWLVAHPGQLVPFGDWDYYYVKTGEIVWQPNPGQNFLEVIVPTGFVTDLTSIPRIFWQILKPEGRYAYAAVVHDYLYWKQDRSRSEADLIFKSAMEDSQVDARIVSILYGAVKRFGRGAWERNTKLKAAGERRFLKQMPRNYMVSWDYWRKQPDVFDKLAPDEEVPPLPLQGRKAPATNVTN